MTCTLYSVVCSIVIGTSAACCILHKNYCEGGGWGEEWGGGGMKPSVMDVEFPIKPIRPIV